ncbi:hypothetical protein NE237_009511 [Protea cynaroides]|uniref:Uncharacterized protein n=1 Tax=Protea cynaroides TaxID=273540 RepID=A0A9Q0KXZ1_9MAGN|nr:hypothetical protein NE237_009511 [Protea cynaroides]
MAAGWNAKQIVEAIGLVVANRHTQARHVCVVPDELSRSEYIEAMMPEVGISLEVMVGEAEEAMEGIPKVDFLVVDYRHKDLFARKKNYPLYLPKKKEEELPSVIVI